MTYTELIDTLNKVDFNAVAIELYDLNQGKILSKVRGQLWDGQKPDGTDITPSYLDDPYFKTRKQAEAYANWKMKLSRNSKRNKYAPNLYINGYFYNSLGLKLENPFEVISTWGEVGAKYKDALGLSLENQDSIIKDYAEKQFEEIITRETGLSF